MSKIMGAGRIENCPDTVNFGDIIVVRNVDDMLWFYGNYKTDLDKAIEVAKEVDGIHLCAMEVD